MYNTVNPSMRIGLLVLLAVLLLTPAARPAQSGLAGDLFVLLSGDQIQWRHADGTLQETLNAREGGSYSELMNLFAVHVNANGRHMEGAHSVGVSADQCAIFYAVGANVRQLNVCGGFQFANFNIAPLPENEASTVRVLPDGGLLVANAGVIARLDPMGGLAQIYDVDGEDCWSSLALSYDRTSFWAGGCNSNVYRFDLGSGAQMAAFSTGTTPFTIRGLAENPPASLKTPQPIARWEVEGRMTGGGSVFAPSGNGNGQFRVTHGFELHCKTTNLPNNLEVNWKNHSWHMDTLTLVDCRDMPEWSPYPPDAPFDWLNGCGMGDFDGSVGRTDGCFTLTDKGEPGSSDTAWFMINIPGDVLNVPENVLHYGNQQAHKEN